MLQVPGDRERLFKSTVRHLTLLCGTVVHFIRKAKTMRV